MVEKEKLDRINELAKKKKEGTLTEEEAEERKALHQEYLRNLRANLKVQLDLIEFVDDDPENWSEEEKENFDYLSDKLGKEYRESQD